MPALTELADLWDQVVTARRAEPLDISVDADAEGAMRASLDRTGLLLLDEVHGIRQTPWVIAALIELLDVHTLALEWPEPLTATVDVYRRSDVLHDHDLLWLGDGRLTPGHLALLRDLAQREPAVGWLAFDTWELVPEIPGESRWTARDHAMARRILDATDPAGRTLVVAGNAHTPTGRTSSGIAMGAWLARERPGLRSIRITYGDGLIYNLGSTPLASRNDPATFRVRLDGDQLLLDHPGPMEADVPHRPDLFVPGTPQRTY
jgi:hypothetical protein